METGGFAQAPFAGAVKVDDIKTGDTLASQDGKSLFRMTVGTTTDSTIDIGICVLGGINELSSWATIKKGYYLNGKKLNK